MTQTNVRKRTNTSWASIFMPDKLFIGCPLHSQQPCGIGIVCIFMLQTSKQGFEGADVMNQNLNLDLSNIRTFILSCSLFLQTVTSKKIQTIHPMKLGIRMIWAVNVWLHYLIIPQSIRPTTPVRSSMFSQSHT